MRFPLSMTVSATVLMLVLAGCGGGRSASAPSTGAEFDGAAYPLGALAPSFTLENQLGRRVSLSALRGQVVVLMFLSTDCRTCFLAAQQVRGALDELAGTPTYGRGTAAAAMRVLFVSTNPHVDTSANVKRFLAETSLTYRVEYLTGTSKELGPIWRAYRIPPPSAGRAVSEMATTVLLIGRSGDERVAFGLEQLTPESLSHDIRLLRDGRSRAPATGRLIP